MHSSQENIEWSGSGVEQKSGISHLFKLSKIDREDSNFQLFGMLRVSTLRFGGSPSLLITFYSNLFGCGVQEINFPSNSVIILKP